MPAACCRLHSTAPAAAAAGPLLLLQKKPKAPKAPKADAGEGTDGAEGASVCVVECVSVRLSARRRLAGARCCRVRAGRRQHSRCLRVCPPLKLQVARRRRRRARRRTPTRPKRCVCAPLSAVAALITLVPHCLPCGQSDTITHTPTRHPPNPHAGAVWLHVLQQRQQGAHQDSQSRHRLWTGVLFAVC
jgi:hypothetical protein